MINILKTAGAIKPYNQNRCFTHFIAVLPQNISCLIKYILQIMPIFVYVWIEYIYNMERKLLNRIKVVLAEKNRNNKWLSEQLDKDPAIISKWVTNTTQPNVEMLIQISKVLDVTVDELLRTE